MTIWRAQRGDRRLTAGWHAATALVIAVSLVAQLVLTVRGISVLVDDTGKAIVEMPTRVLRFFTYFTIQSNILAMTMAVSLLLRPHRDGRLWRVARVASVVGMTVTFVVYLVALAPILDLEGVAWWTDIGFHIAAPLLTTGGWLLFGPWPRFDGRSVAFVPAVAGVLDRLRADPGHRDELVSLSVPRCRQPRLPPRPAQTVCWWRSCCWGWASLPAGSITASGGSRVRLQRRGSTGSDSRARTPNTGSWMRHSGSPRARRSRLSSPSAYSRRASDFL